MHHEVDRTTQAKFYPRRDWCGPVVVNRRHLVLRNRSRLVHRRCDVQEILPNDPMARACCLCVVRDPIGLGRRDRALSPVRVIPDLASVHASRRFFKKEEQVVNKC